VTGTKLKEARRRLGWSLQEAAATLAGFIDAPVSLRQLRLPTEKADLIEVERRWLSLAR
jgi:hypothetical protein